MICSISLNSPTYSKNISTSPVIVIQKLFISTNKMLLSHRAAYTINFHNLNSVKTLWFALPSFNFTNLKIPFFHFMLYNFSKHLQHAIFRYRRFVLSHFFAFTQNVLPEAHIYNTSVRHDLTGCISSCHTLQIPCEHINIKWRWIKETYYTLRQSALWVPPSGSTPGWLTNCHKPPGENQIHFCIDASPAPTFLLKKSSMKQSTSNATIY